jgi:hypothetical protein
MRDDGQVAEKRHQRAEMAQWLVVELYVLLAVAPLVIAAAFPSFWDHSRNPFVAALIVILQVGNILRRSGSWFLLVLVDALMVISYTWDWVGGVTFALNLLTLVLLFSPPMRRYVRLGETGFSVVGRQRPS